MPRKKPPFPKGDNVYPVANSVVPGMGSDSSPPKKSPSRKGNLPPAGNTALEADSSSQNTRPNSSANDTRDQNPFMHPNRILFSREKLITGWVGQNSVGPGLANLGNSCYVNSVIQALIHVTPLRNWLTKDSKEHSTKCKDKEKCTVCGLRKTLLAMMESLDSKWIKPVEMISRLKSINENYSKGGQEDAHEMMNLLLQSAQRSLLQAYTVPHLDRYSEQTTPIGQIFGGVLRTTVTCCTCGTPSHTLQHMYEINLDITGETSIKGAMDSFFTEDNVEGVNCVKCNDKVQATKRYFMEKPPLALIIQLKRFSGFATKNTNPIFCDPNLDLRKYLHETGREQIDSFEYKFTLVSSITHLGATPLVGHYKAICKTHDGVFYEFNDTSVTEATKSNATHNDSYVIIYEVESNTNQVSTNAVTKLQGTKRQEPAEPPTTLNKKQKMNNCCVNLGERVENLDTSLLSLTRRKEIKKKSQTTLANEEKTTTDTEKDTVENRITVIGTQSGKPEKESPPVKSKEEEYSIDSDGRFVCKICGNSLKNMKQLGRHRREKHGVNKWGECEFCSLQFTHLTLRKEHILAVHGERPYKCSVCGSDFEKKDQMKIHMLSHLRQPGSVKKPLKRLHQKSKLKPRPEEFIFLCTDCNNLFKTSSLLYQHKRRFHKYRGTFICEICSEVFNNINDRAMHRRSVHGEYSYKCSFNGCDKKFKTKSELKEHADAHATNCKYMCAICQLQYKSRSGLRQHVRKKHNKTVSEANKETEKEPTKKIAFNRGTAVIKQNRPRLHIPRQWPCRICGEIFTNIRERHRHVAEQHGLRPWKCTVCNADFLVYDALKTHQMRCHCTDKHAYCKKCDKQFRNLYGLRIHNLHVHQEGIKYTCHYCGLKFNVRHYLNKHLLENHNVQNIVKCGSCEKYFCNKWSAQNHFKRTHHLKNKYACRLCKNKYAHRRSLLTHMKREHDTDYLYCCEDCSQQFTRMSLLLEHEKQEHLDLRKYICKKCGRGFKEKHQLEYHSLRINCSNCAYVFRDDQMKEMHFKMHHNGQFFHRTMSARQGDLVRGLKSSTEVKKDFLEIYSLSKTLYPFNNSHRKLYGLVFVPPKVAENELFEYLNDSSNERYYYVGKVCAGCKSRKISDHHMTLQPSAAASIRINSGFTCYHIFDIWIADKFKGQEYDIESLAYLEAITIIKLFMFAVYYGREDLFIQKLELKPIYNLQKKVIEELLEDVKRAEGNIQHLTDFEYQFQYEIPIDNNKIVNDPGSLTCKSCNSSRKLYTEFMRMRHNAFCSPKKKQKALPSKMESLLSMKKIDINSITQQLRRNPITHNNYSCYTVEAIEETVHSRESLKSYDGPKRIYQGQNSYGNVSRYHFEQGKASTIKNLVKEGQQVYFMYKWNCRSKDEMFKLETVLQLKEFFCKNDGNKHEIAIKWLKLYNVSKTFTVQEWESIFETYSDTISSSDYFLPPFLNIKPISMFQNITKRVLDAELDKVTIAAKNYDLDEDEETENSDSRQDQDSDSEEDDLTDDDFNEDELDLYESEHEELSDGDDEEELEYQQ